MGCSSGSPLWQEEVGSGPSRMTIRTAKRAMNLRAAREHPGRSDSRAKSKHSVQGRLFRSFKSADNRDHSQHYRSDTKIFIGNSRTNKCSDGKKVLHLIRLMPDEDEICSISVLNVILIVLPASLMSF
jgi:hypothetical protein